MAEARWQRRLRRFAAEPMRSRLSPPADFTRRRWQLGLVIPGLMLLVIACARPQWGERTVDVRERARNLMVVLDVSRSMLATDVQPNRLERARSELLDLVDALEGDRVGLIAFRNGAVTICPLTRDYAFFKFALNGVDIDSAPPGPTDIAAGIHGALAALETSGDGHHAILLVSDGEALTGDIKQSAGIAADRGIPIFTLSIGTRRGSPIPDGSGGWLTFEGETVVSRLELETMETIAALTGGISVPLGDAGALRGFSLGELYRRHLQGLVAAEQSHAMLQRRVDRQGGFLVAGTLLLMAAAGLSPGRYRRRATAITALSALSLLMLATPLSAADPLDAQQPEPTDWADADTPAEALRLAQHAQAFFQAGNYLEAAAAFDAAGQSLDPVRADICRFNAALALARNGAFEPAANRLEPLRRNPRLARKATRLFGEIRYAQARTSPDASRDARLAWLTEAVAAFRQALDLHPDCPELQRALSTAVSALRDTREAARIDALLQAHGHKPPDALLQEMLLAQREVSQKAATAAARLPDHIALQESAAALQDDVRDLLIPLKSKMLDQAGADSNPDLSDILEHSIGTLREIMAQTARKLRDLDPDAPELATKAEAPVFSLWEPLAMPPSLIDMAMIAQSNALYHPPPPHHRPRAWQSETKALVRAFQDRFPGWAEAWNAQAASPDQHLSDETRATILQLTRQTLDLQAEAHQKLQAEQAAQSEQKTALDTLKVIRELLPSPPDSSAPDNQSEPPPSDQPSQPEALESSSPPPPAAEPPETADATESDDRRLEADRIERLLDRALQREREHADEQRQRARDRPAREGVRDW